MTTCPKCRRIVPARTDWLEGFCPTCKDWTADPNFSSAMIRDPFKRPPLEAQVRDEALQKAVKKALGSKAKERVLFLTPATRPKSIIDAKDDVRCDACAGACWISPSSRGELGTAAVLCLACLEKASGLDPLAFLLAISGR